MRCVHAGDSRASIRHAKIGGATHFLKKTLRKVAAERRCTVLAYNLTRVNELVGVRPLLAAIRPEVWAPWPPLI